MPTRRFYRLPEEKRKTIRDAAIKEFIRVPYDKASINKMIQSAEISRGSFYTYFEDKEDVLSFILLDVRNQGKALAIELLEKNQGDIWVMLHEMLKVGMQYCSNHDMFRLFKNIVTYPEVETVIHRGCGDEEKNGEFIWIYDYIDTSRFKDQDADTLKDIISIGMGILGEAIGQFCKDYGRREQVEAEFLRRMELLKYGACKKA